MSSLELEAGKLELIREIVNINSSTALELSLIHISEPTRPY